MDFKDQFKFEPRYGILICKSCAFAVAPLHLRAHIAKGHAVAACYAISLDSARATSKAKEKAAALLADSLNADYRLPDPTSVTIPIPLPTDPPLPELTLHQGYQCAQCDLVVTKTVENQLRLQKHFNKHHRSVPRKRGRQSKIADIPAMEKLPMTQDVFCQRFFVAGAQSSFFAVYVPPQKSAREIPGQDAAICQAWVQEQLAKDSLEREVREKRYSSQVSKTEILPWLEKTRWPRYFHGLNVADVAPLAYAANPITEPALVLLGESFDRLIERAYQSICEDKISVFDQARINSFNADGPGEHDRMIIVKLLKSTSRAHKGIWKRLLCFVYRTSQLNQSTPLLHIFTEAQLFHLGQAVCLAKKLSSL